jgi:hypothetical protein
VAITAFQNTRNRADYRERAAISAGRMERTCHLTAHSGRRVGHRGTHLGCSLVGHLGGRFLVGFRIALTSLPPAGCEIHKCWTAAEKGSWGRGGYSELPELRNHRPARSSDWTRRRCSAIHASASASVENGLTLVG